MVSAAIYLGADTVQMLIANLRPEAEPEIINEFTAFTKLSRELEKTSLLDQDGLLTAEKAFQEMHRIAAEEGVTVFRIAASSALRNAANRTKLFVSCSKEFGVFPTLLSGKDEAKLHFLGTVVPEYAKIPLIVAYLGYNSISVACGTRDSIGLLAEIPVGPGLLNDVFHTNQKSLNGWQRFHLRLWNKRKFLPFLMDFAKWKHSCTMDPELFLIGPFPTAYVSMENGQPVSSLQTMSSAPHKCSELSVFAKKLLKLTPEERKKIPMMDPNMAENSAACAILLKAVVKSCGMKEFHVAPNGLCQGLLKTVVSE